MPFDIVFRTDDLTKWGSGKGTNLLPAEVDDNFWALLTRLDYLVNNPVQANNIVNITFENGVLTFTMGDGTSYAVPFPSMMIQWAGEWQAGATYRSYIDLFSVSGSGVYFTLQTHTSVAPFNPDATINAQAVYALMMPAPAVQPYDLSMYYSARVLGDSVVLFEHVVARPLVMPTGLPSSQAVFRVGTSTAAISLPIEVNGTQVGSIDFDAAGSPGTFTFTADVNINVGDRITIWSDSVADDTAQGLAVTLVLQYQQPTS